MGRNPQRPYALMAKASPERLTPCAVPVGAADADSGLDDTGTAYARPPAHGARGLPFYVIRRRRRAGGRAWRRAAETRRGPDAARGIRASSESCRLKDDDCEHVAGRQHEEVLAAELDLGAAVL